MTSADIKPFCIGLALMPLVVLVALYIAAEDACAWVRDLGRDCLRDKPWRNA